MSDRKELASSALAVCGRARKRLGPASDQLKALQEESRQDPLAEEAISTALSGDDPGAMGLGKDVLDRIEDWAHRILAEK